MDKKTEIKLPVQVKADTLKEYLQGPLKLYDLRVPSDFQKGQRRRAGMD